MSNAKLKLTFELYKDGAKTGVIELEQDIIKVGKLKTSHLRIEDDNVSRMHAVIEVTKPDEVWIIAKSDGPRIQSPVDDQPGTGSLVATLDGSEEQIPVPLKHTEVSGAINGIIASVNVQQQFHNPYSQKIEAIYQFPLPEDAAVSASSGPVDDGSK